MAMLTLQGLGNYASFIKTVNGNDRLIMLPSSLIVNLKQVLVAITKASNDPRGKALKKNFFKYFFPKGYLIDEYITKVSEQPFVLFGFDMSLQELKESAASAEAKFGDLTEIGANADLEEIRKVYGVSEEQARLDKGLMAAVLNAIVTK